MERIRPRTICAFATLFLIAAWLAACTVQPVTPGTATETAVPAAQIGRDASWEQAFAWHREGGAAGFCDDVVVYVTGDVYISSCRGEQPVDLARTRLDAAQLDALFGWLDAFRPFEYERTDPAQNDGAQPEPVRVRLVFSGAGEEEALEPDQALMIDFMQNLYNEGWMGASEPPAVCPIPAAAQQLLIQLELGYCLLYPAAYSLVQTNPTGMEIVMDTVMNHIDPRLSISVEEANGRTLPDVADAIAANYVPPGFTIERTPITVDGVDAVMFDELPGQDLNRRVVFVHNGRLYNFFLSPLGDPGTETRQQAETLYQTALDSFRWLDGVPPIAPSIPTAVPSSTPGAPAAPK